MACAAALYFMATSAAAPSAGAADGFAASVEAALTRRGLGHDALAVIGNVIRHEGPPPRAAPPIVLDLLVRPLAATEAATLFDRAVPASLRRLGGPPVRVTDQGSIPIAELLAGYLDELAEAQRVLREATADTTIDGKTIVRQFSRPALPPTPFRGLTPPMNPARLERAAGMFIDATARFADVLRARGDSVQFPGQAVRFDSAVGVVSIGSRGDDHHGPDAAVIVDPGGNDSYERRPTTGGAVSVIIDLAGADRYHGVDIVVHGFSAIVDFSGNDRYVMSGPGLGAAVAGASIILDLAGDDVYEARVFGQGAAAFGIGAIIDMSGNDAYRLQAVGQGLGMAGGFGLLWDRGGNDSYEVGGLSDAFDRGGGISMAQGAAYGARTWSGGGIGILRDDEGDDVYHAEMFAQGVGYYYGFGLLWDRSGNDRYRAVRYAQGNGVHEAVGVLRDDIGDDRYELAYGVGQGMGLDLAVGMLVDAAGDDRYQSEVLAQGAATANGIGMIIDGGGTDEWRMGADTRSWGRVEWNGGLPTLGLLLHEPARATFMRDDQVVPQPDVGVANEGPPGVAPVARGAAGEPGCAKAVPGAAASGLPLGAALRAIAPGFTGGSADPAIQADVQRRLTTRLAESMREIRPDDFNVAWSFNRALRCAIAAAAASEAELMWTALEQALNADRAMPLALTVVSALQLRPPPAAQADRMLRALDDHPQCSVRASALFLRHAVSTDESMRSAAAAAAQAAMRSSCWRLQAAGRSVLGRLEVVPDDEGDLPSFLRGAPGGPPGGSAVAE